MSLLLKVENVDRLPDGGPLFAEVFGRGLDLGRDQHLDWTLPDSSRFISGKHCEIRYRNGEYHLTDVSTNGTFMAGSDQRIQSPYRLRDGDRLAIGHYIVSVSIKDEVAPRRDADLEAVADAIRRNPWDSSEGAAPPLPPAALRAKPAVPRADPLDWIADIPPPSPVSAAPDPWSPPAPPPRREAPPPTDDSWMGPAPAVRQPAAPPPAPTPRRPAAPAPSADDWLTATPLPVVPTPVSAEPASAEGSFPPGHPGPLPPGPIPVPMPGEPPVPMPGPLPPTPVPVPPDPFPPPLPEGSARPSPPAGAGMDAGSLADAVARIARAAGIPADVIAARPPDQLADEIGQVLALAMESLRQMLVARAETKSLVRSSSHTVIRAFDNNPLKFTPSSEEAMRIMFGPPSRNYLRAAPAVEQGFTDLKKHQAQTYAAMQSALETLLMGLSPSAVEESTGPDKGIGGLVGSRKSRLWDTYSERWRTLSGRQDERLTEAFMRLFAESYDKLQSDGR